jgi:hypothetical protein
MPHILSPGSGVMIDPALIEAIKVVLGERNSGGCKLTKLIADLGSMGIVDVSPEELIKTIQTMRGVKILKYGWNMWRGT